MKYIDIAVVYDGSNGDATRALYAKLEKVGPLGVVALNLFRALKTSSKSGKPSAAKASAKAAR